MHIRHTRTRGPRIGRYIVDPGDVIVHPACGIFTAKHVDLVRRRVIHCRSLDRRLRHAHHRCPSVRHWIKPVHHRKGRTRAEGVTPSCIEECPVGSACRPIQIRRHVCHILPRPGRAARLASRRRGRRTCYRRCSRRCRGGRATALQDVALPASSRATTAVAEVLGKGGVVLLHSRCGRCVAISHRAIDHVKARLPLIQPQLEVGSATSREVL